MKISLAFVLVLISAASIWAITIDTVPVGDVGNPNDPATGNTYGGVNYAYNIGKYEVTVGQYATFLNAVASANDPYGLYNPSMATDLRIAGITRTGSPGTYSYSPIGSPNHPVTYVSWGDAARFTNWLQNGHPIGVEGPGTTETGAYTLNGATTDVAYASVTRNAGAIWVIPSENEWYKAAYYQPAAKGGDADSYWGRPMRTNSEPFSDQPPGATPDNTRVGNFIAYDGIANGYDDGYAVTGSQLISATQNYLTDAGAYTSTANYYGTFDQGGNVAEWNEANANFSFPNSRGLRGGSWNNDGLGLSPFYNFGRPANEESDFEGFRVASLVPEPDTTLLGIIVGLATWFVRKRVTRQIRPPARDFRRAILSCRSARPLLAA